MKFRSSGGRKRRTTIDFEDDVEMRQSSSGGLRNSSSWNKSPLKARKRSSAPKMQSDIVHPMTTPGPSLNIKDMNIGDQADALALSPRMGFSARQNNNNTEYSVLEELYAMDSANRSCADCNAESKLPVKSQWKLANVPSCSSYMDQYKLGLSVVHQL